MRNNRKIQLLKILMRQEDYIKGEEICNEMNVSGRTLRGDFNEFKPLFFENGIEIISKQAKGYALHIFNEDAYHNFIYELMKEEEHSQKLLPVYPEDRINYLIRLFLTQSTYLKMEDIADMLFISRATLTNDLRQVRERLSYFHLQLVSRPAYGLKIEGEEIHMRSCIAQYFYHTDTIDARLQHSAEDEKIDKIKSILLEALYTYELHLTDVGFQNLVIHISIAITRNSNEQKSFVSDEWNLSETYEYAVAKAIVMQLEQTFQITLNPIECEYITIHLLGKKRAVDENHHEIDEETLNLLTAIMREINMQYGYDFSNDFELYTLLALHFLPMLNRLKFGLRIQNPLLHEIKNNNLVAFEMGVCCANVIEKEINVEVDENEIGYLALHLALAIERYKKQSISKKNIVIVCASGAGSSQILLYKMKQRFQEYLNEIKVCELYELEQLDVTPYDFVMSTVPIPFACKIPVIRVKYFLNDQDASSVEKMIKSEQNDDVVTTFFSDAYIFNTLKGKTREQILNEMIDKLSLVANIPDALLQEVLKRENYAATEFGNEIALPHAMHPVCETSFVSIGILDKPIIWFEKPVRYIFLLCVSKQKEEHIGMLQEMLSELLMRKDLMDQFALHPTTANLHTILQDLNIQTDDEDIFK